MGGLYRAVRLGICHRAVVILRFAPEEVTDELDQEGVATGRLGCLLNQVGRDTEAGGGEDGGERPFNVADARRMEVDFVGPAQERGNAFIEQVGYGCRQSGEYPGRSAAGPG